MFKRTLLVTSALVVAASMAVAAGNHKNMSPVYKARVAKTLVPVGKGKFGAAAAVMNTKLGTQHGKPASWQDIKTPGTTFSNFSSSANAAFISWYGWYGQAVSASGTTSRCNSTYTSCYQVGYNATIKQAAAEKFTGTGRVAKKIELGAFAIPNYSSCSYWNSCHTSVGNVGLYSNGTGAACSGTSRAGAPSCPGTAIHNASGNFSATPSSALCCTVITVPIHKTTLAAGTQYWVAVTGASGGSNVVGWDLENSDFSFNPLGSIVYHTVFHTNFTTGGTNSYNSGWLTDNSGIYPGAVKL
jgi:hypothetical protein